MHNAICERAARTLKSKLYRYFDANHTRVWYNVLQLLMKSYNTTFNRSLGMSPSAVNIDNYEHVYKKLYGTHGVRTPPKLSIGNIVRLSRLLNFTSKAYENQFSRALYIITKGPFYTLKGVLPMYKIKQIGSDAPTPGS